MRSLLLAVLWFFPLLTFAAVEKVEAYDMSVFKNDVKKYYKTVERARSNDLTQRIHAASGYFLGKPYMLFPQGEGKRGKYDQKPTYRTDAFDCVTYVEAVIALSLANDYKTFEKFLMQLRYKNGRLGFITRNHITSVDWNKNNSPWVKDITNEITDNQGWPVTQFARVMIDKGGFFRVKADSPLYLLKEITPKEEDKRREVLTRFAYKQQPQDGTMLYIPLTRLFNKKQKPNEALFKQIPDGTIVQIIRPNWDVREKVGTNLNVSHMGFAIKKDGKLYYREASSIDKKVIDILLTSYLKKQLKSPTVKGIAVFKVVVPA